MNRFAVVAAATAAGASLILFGGTATAAEPVPVPPDYVYDPGLGSLHDYCSSSPDEPPIWNGRFSWRSVDFRGPCARHDLCYEGDAEKEVCDANFEVDLVQQCDATFAAGSSYLPWCHRTADAYHAFVVAFGNALG